MKTQTSSLESPHFPVMLSEILKISSPSKGGVFLDCTFGGGGYSKAILKFPNTKVIAFDRDIQVFHEAKKLEDKYLTRFKFYQKKFSQIPENLKNNVDIIIFDLGLSMMQIKDLKRGFSFNSSENLDMSMGLSDISAKDVVNNLSEGDLKLVIKIFGEEREAAKIAKNIVKARDKKKITKVDELVKIIESSKKRKFSSKINPSTKTFQALRIFVNKEITEIINGIVNATKFLKPGGKILVVSFHSIEDRVIKYFFTNYSDNRSRPSRYLPEDNNNLSLFKNYDNKIIKPSKKEIDLNYSSRSAKLRFAIRNENKFIIPKKLFEKFNKYLDLEAINV